MVELSSNFWSDRYKTGQTAWDLGKANEALINLFEEVDKEKTILFPGAGNAYEAEFLFNAGFKNVFVLDWAKEPLENLKKRCPGFPQEQLIQSDFFNLNLKFDIIVEQTFFCAIDMSLRQHYADKVSSILNDKGKLMGLMFCVEKIDEPPFGGSLEEYHALFDPLFSKVEINKTDISIKPRLGRECLIIAQK